MCRRIFSGVGRRAALLCAMGVFLALVAVFASTAQQAPAPPPHDHSGMVTEIMLYKSFNRLLIGNAAMIIGFFLTAGMVWANYKQNSKRLGDHSSKITAAEQATVAINLRFAKFDERFAVFDTRLDHIVETTDKLAQWARPESMDSTRA